MIKIPEYLAMGRAVVSYDLPEARVSAGDAALYATPGDAEALGRAVATLLDDPARRAEMGEIGLRRVSEQLAWQHSERVLAAAYARACADERPAESVAKVAVAPQA